MFPTMPKRGDLETEELKIKLLKQVAQLGASLPVLIRDELAYYLPYSFSYFFLASLSQSLSILIKLPECSSRSHSAILC